MVLSQSLGYLWQNIFINHQNSNFILLPVKPRKGDIFQEVSLHVVAISQQRLTTDHVEETKEPQTY